MEMRNEEGGGAKFENMSDFWSWLESPTCTQKSAALVGIRPVLGARVDQYTTAVGD